MKLTKMQQYVLLQVIAPCVAFYFGFVFVEQKWVPDYNDLQAAKIPAIMLISFVIAHIVRWYIKKRRDTKESIS